MLNFEDLIKLLELDPLLAEGGFFRETYRSSLRVTSKVGDAAFLEKRNICTAIYYLLTPYTHSKLHRLSVDEMYHFYLGDPVEMLQLHSDGTAELVKIGNDILAGFHPQIVVPGNSWQGCRLVQGGNFALMGTTMAPGFEFDDLIIANQSILINQYPKFSNMIKSLTSNTN